MIKTGLPVEYLNFLNNLKGNLTDIHMKEKCAKTYFQGENTVIGSIAKSSYVAYAPK